jgi:hypothetical protein
MDHAAATLLTDFRLPKLTEFEYIPDIFLTLFLDEIPGRSSVPFGPRRF